MLACLALELVVNAAGARRPLRPAQGRQRARQCPVEGITRADALLRFPRAVEGYPQTVVVLTACALMVLGAPWCGGGATC